MKLFINEFSKISVLHSIAAIALGLFFVYAGVKKFIPKPPKPNTAVEATVNAVQSDVYENPLTFKLTIKMLKTSGFLKMVGLLQILSGLLMVFSATRIIGLGLLLPVTINIFCLHAFMDNRPEELWETGTYLLVNIVLLGYYCNSIKQLVLASNKPQTNFHT